MGMEKKNVGRPQHTKLDVSTVINAMFAASQGTMHIF